MTAIGRKATATRKNCEWLLHFAFQPLEKVDVNCRLLTLSSRS